MRDGISPERPALLLLFADATGGWRGKSVTHVECGAGDWRAGKALSRLTLDPLAFGEGKDDCANLHVMLDTRTAPSVNRVINNGTITLSLPGPEDKSISKTIPAEVLFSADMQAHKAAAGQHSVSHSPWCDCTDQWQMPDALAVANWSWKDVEAWYKKIGCKLKTAKQQCARAHRSYELWRGKQFKPFSCDCCSYKSGDLKTYQAAVAKFDALDAAEQKKQSSVHASDHFWKLLGLTPLFDLDLDHFSPDDLHLVHLNIFKRLFDRTVYLKLTDEMQQVLEDFLRASGFPIKVRSDDATLACNWIGRDCKKFIEMADIMLPHCLHLANVPSEAGAAAAAACKKAAVAATFEDDGDDDDIDPEFAPTDEDVQREEQDEGEMMQHARDWDVFIHLAQVALRPWDAEDTEEYRERRALESFKAAVPVVEAIRRHDLSSTSWCPHVLLCIVPRMQRKWGCSVKRGADVSEAFGAEIKYTIHRLVVRRPLAIGKKLHIKRNAAGEEIKRWQQTFKASRVEQTFRRVCVRKAMLDDASFDHLKQRQHAVARTTGRACKVQKTTPARATGQSVEEAMAAYDPATQERQRRGAA